MNLKERIEEVVEDKIVTPLTDRLKKPFVKAVIGQESSSTYIGDILQDATTEILKVIRESLPEKKEEPKSDIWLDWSEIEFIHNGYNQALKDTQEKLK